MTESPNYKLQDANNIKITKNKFDLEERTLAFSKEIIRICNILVKNQTNNILIGQVLRSATSIGANYREANDSLGKKDFLLRTRISRKEAKETTYWLELIKESNQNLRTELNLLIEESVELRNILSSIVSKVNK